MSASDNIHLTVLTPEKTLLEKLVTKISLPGSKGRFMILRNHAPLISSLEEGDLVYESEGVEERVHVMSGFVEVIDNEAVVCVEL